MCHSTRGVALTRAELIRAVLDSLEGAGPAIDADGPALVPKPPPIRIELKADRWVSATQRVVLCHERGTQ